MLLNDAKINFKGWMLRNHDRQKFLGIFFVANLRALQKMILSKTLNLQNLPKYFDEG
jgi:hypothetical protein